MSIAAWIESMSLARDYIGIVMAVLVAECDTCFVFRVYVYVGFTGCVSCYDSSRLRLLRTL